MNYFNNANTFHRFIFFFFKINPDGWESDIIKIYIVKVLKNKSNETFKINVYYILFNFIPSQNCAVSVSTHTQFDKCPHHRYECALVYTYR